MKRIGLIRKRFLSRERILLIIEELTKQGRRSRWTASTQRKWQLIEADPLTFADRLALQLRTQTWQPAGFSIFYKREGRKLRKIYASAPEELIVDTLLADCLEYVFCQRKHYIPGNCYGSIRGKGQHELRDRIFKKVRGRRRAYIATCDTRHYYPTIDHELLKQTLRRHIKDSWMLWLCEVTIDRMPDGQGIALGLPSSNLLGHIYHCDLDWQMLTRYGISHYYRFCDNKYILHTDPTTMHTAVRELRDGIHRLRQTMKPDWKVTNLNRDSAEVLGSRMDTRRMRLLTASRRRIEHRFAVLQRLQDPQLAAASWAGVRGSLRHLHVTNLTAYWRREYPEYFRLLRVAGIQRLKHRQMKLRHERIQCILAEAFQVREEEVA